MTQLICGVDEAGRGPLAGPVIAAAVILNPDNPIEGLNDSKKLSEKRREELDLQIRECAEAFALGRAEADEIDRINILQASLLAMRRAVEGLGIVPGKVLVDGNRVPALSYPCEALVGGDALVKEISAASIIAKVARDNEMVSMAESYPQYGFERHKGYPTRAHIEALNTHGPCAIHRRSFGPVNRLLLRLPGL